MFRLHAIDRKHHIGVAAARDMPPPLLLGLALAGAEVRVSSQNPGHDV